MCHSRKPRECGCDLTSMKSHYPTIVADPRTLILLSLRLSIFDLNPCPLIELFEQFKEWNVLFASNDLLCKKHGHHLILYLETFYDRLIDSAGKRFDLRQVKMSTGSGKSSATNNGDKRTLILSKYFRLYFKMPLETGWNSGSKMYTNKLSSDDSLRGQS